MLHVLRYIYRENRGLWVIKHFFLGIFWQVFKRSARSVLSKRLFNGKEIFLYPNCNVSSKFFYTQIPDKVEVMTLRSFIRADADNIFIDIGANIGSYSVMLCDICERVLAFEPHPYTVLRCKMNFLLNNLDEKSVYRTALSNINGELLFSDYGGSSTVNHIVAPPPRGFFAKS